jgi:hypothetical protein
MRFWPAYLRAAVVAAAIVVVGVISLALVGPSGSDETAGSRLWAHPDALLDFIILAFAFTLILGGIAHWFLRASGWHNRLHYIVAGLVLGVLTAIVTYSLSTPWAAVINTAAWGSAGAAAANTFWISYARGA